MRSDLTTYMLNSDDVEIHHTGLPKEAFSFTIAVHLRNFLHAGYFYHFAHLGLYIHTSTCTHLPMHACMSMRTHAHTDTHSPMHVLLTHMHTHIHTHTHMHTSESKVVLKVP